jgi:uncharacterized protein YndB with AHSA1/START domain
MMSETASLSTETTLILKRTVEAPRSKVFEAWTNPDLLKQWFLASDEYVSPFAEVDLRIGGKYRMAMRHIEKGIEHVATGIYKEILPPSRLVFTWSWEGEQADGDTIVTIEFRDMGTSTEIVLKHEYFRTKESRDQHEMGWNGCFRKLQTLFHE